MKVLIDARHLSDRPTGIGRVAAGLVAELPRLDSDVRYVVFVHKTYPIPPDPPPNVVYRPLPWRPVSLGTLLRLRSRIDRERADLLHVLHPVIPLGVRGPTVVTFHDWQPLSVPNFSGARPAPIEAAYNAFYRRMYPYAARRATRIIADSDFTRAETERRVPESRGKCVTIHPGLEPAFFEPMSDEKLEAKARALDLPSRYILYVGSTRPNKEIDTLLRAFARLVESRADLDNLKLVLVLSIDRFFAPRRRLIEELRLVGRVRLMERLGESDLKAVYRRAILLSMATTEEGFGFPALEAMALGTPVVIADSGALPEIAAAPLSIPPRDPATRSVPPHDPAPLSVSPHDPAALSIPPRNPAALSVPPRDPDALAAAFAMLFDDAPRRRQIIDAARLRAREFTTLRAAERTLNLYREILES